MLSHAWLENTLPQDESGSYSTGSVQKKRRKDVRYLVEYLSKILVESGSYSTVSVQKKTRTVE